jgi:hypothetical protein
VSLTDEMASFAISKFISFFDFLKEIHSTFFNERIMMAIIQEDENYNTSRRRVIETSE